MKFLKKIFGLAGSNAQPVEVHNETPVEKVKADDKNIIADDENAGLESSADVAADAAEEEHERRYKFETLRDDGLRAMQSQHIEYAVKCFLAALEYQEDNDTRYSLSECYILLHQGSKALPILQSLQEANSENIQLFLDAAIAAEQMQDWTVMENYAQKALELRPDDDNALYILGRSKFCQGEYATAEKYLTKLLEKNEAYISVRLLRARAYYEQHKLDEAEIDLNNMIQMESATDETYLLQGMIHEAKGDVDAAVVAYQKILELDPFNIEAPMKLARIAMDRHCPEQALTVLDEAINMREDFIPAYRLRAEVKRSMGNEPGAKTDEQKAAELIPEDLKGEENLEESMNNFYKSINPYGF